MVDNAFVPLTGEYEPSTQAWVRDEVEHIERTAGSAFADRAVVLLTTLGARTGKVRKTPLMRVEHAGTYAAVASMGGSGVHPQWYYNVLSHPIVDLRDGGVVLSLTAREIFGEERSRWWSRACTAFPAYADYQSRTRRKIPVVLLEPLPEP